MSKLTGAPTIIAANNAGTTPTGSALTGSFLLIADQDIFVATGAPGGIAPVASSTSFFLPAKTILKISLAGEFVAARCVTNATGNVYVQPTSDL